MTLIDDLKESVDEWGEVHARVSDHDAEVEIRRGQAEFRDADGVVRVKGPDHDVYFDYDSFVSFYRPIEVFH